MSGLKRKIKIEKGKKADRPSKRRVFRDSSGKVARVVQAKGRLGSAAGIRVEQIDSVFGSLPRAEVVSIPQKILNQAIEVIGSYDAAMKWFSTPSIALGSIPPVVMLTKKGSEEVEKELLRIEAGVL